jgi:bleomycin hydrolase
MRTTAAATLLLFVAGSLCTPGLASGNDDRDEARYVDALEYPVLEEMRELNEQQREQAREKTQEILDRIAERRERREESEQELRFDLSGVDAPGGPKSFETLWHHPPTPQYLTGSCWSFSATSFLESEIARLHDRQVKLSEMWTVYWEYVEKARRYVRQRGQSRFTMGSEANAIYRIYDRYGAVPRSAYEGTLEDDGRFDHAQLYDGMKELLEWCEAQAIWDEELVVRLVRELLDRAMGRPPESFLWNSNTYTPKEFRDAVCQLELDAYVSLMSTLSESFYTRGVFDVPDNWWRDDSYVNVPLDVWYDVILRATDRGYSVVLGGDVSEPGLWGPADIAVIPSFDVPRSHLDQSARELRISNGTTTDDHGVHLVGHTRHAGDDWFLVKDSNRSSRLGEHEGYYMYRSDYVRLKMLTLGVHRDLVSRILERVEQTSNSKDLDEEGQQ